MDKSSFYRSRIKHCALEARRAICPGKAATWRGVGQDYEFLLELEQAGTSPVIGQTSRVGIRLGPDQREGPVNGADVADALQAIADSEIRIEELRARIEQMAASGFSTKLAEAALAERGRGLWYQRTLLFDLRKHLNLVR